MRKNQEKINNKKNKKVESSNWSDVHKDFDQKWYGETYQQLREGNGLIRQDAQEWMRGGFSPRDYLAVKYKIKPMMKLCY